jgi:hypothetical protein
MLSSTFLTYALGIFVSGVYGQVITLGSASSYGVLAATTITNTDLTDIQGGLAVSPGTAITGFPPGIFAGPKSTGDSTAAAAKSDASTAFNAINALPCDTMLTGQDLGGKTLTPGVYCFASSGFLSLGSTLTLDAQGNADAQFVFKTGTTLITGIGSKVVLRNSARPCRVFWGVGSSATLDVGTLFIGNVLAAVSISVNNLVSVSGGLYALSGTVTLIHDTIAVTGPCPVSASPKQTPPSQTPPSQTPSPPAPGGTPTTVTSILSAGGFTVTVTVMKPTVVHSTTTCTVTRTK